MQTIILCAFALALGAADDTSTSTTTPGVVATTSSSTTTPAAAAADTSTSSTTTPAAAAATTSSTTTPGVVATTTSSTTTPAAAAATTSSTSSTSSSTSKTSTSSSTSSTSSSTTTAAALAASSSLSSSTAAASSSSSIDMGPWTDTSYLEGTWQSKSGMVVTGPDFYDPVHELLIDPGLPGWSYSFTSDGYWEEAIYQITSDGSHPTCPSAVLIFQHGTWEATSNGSLVLTPFADDGRQLLSEPCATSGSSTYSRYEQQEIYKQWYVEIDNYYGRYKLQLYKFDGSLMPPLYLGYKPPQMLPTETMNPTSNGSSSASSSGAARQRIRRSLENARNIKKRSAGVELRQKAHFDWLWYGGVSLMVGGGLAFAVLS